MSTPIDIVKRFYEEIWSQGNLEVVDELVHEKYHPKDILMEEDGPALIKREVTYFQGVFSNVKYEVLDAVEDGNRVWVRYRYSGVHSGTAWGFEATGKTFENEGAAIFTLEDNKVRDAWRSYCFYELFHSLDLVPPWWELSTHFSNTQ